MMVRKLLLFVLFLIPLHSCNSQKPEKTPMKYLALGDSYTIGERVAENERWPVVLAEKLRNDGIEIENPKIIAVTGWTTDELKSAIKKEALQEEFGLVSLLIGVNNQYRGYDIDIYKKEFKELLDMAIGFAGGDATKVFVVSIPDYGVTPFAKNGDVEKIAKEIEEYNNIAKGFCEEQNIPFYNITPISKKAFNNLDLVANDGLHPSALMYAEWVEFFYRDVYDLISK